MTFTVYSSDVGPEPSRSTQRVDASQPFSGPIASDDFTAADLAPIQHRTASREYDRDENMNLGGAWAE